MNDYIHDLKTPPHSVEAEQAVLGGLMLSPDSWEQIDGVLQQRDFYRPDHRAIFHAITSLHAEGKTPDVLTLSEWLQNRGELERAGGMVYLGTMAKDTPSAANIKAYAGIVREKSLLRSAVSRCEQAIGEAFSKSGKKALEIIDETIRDLMAYSEIRTDYECTLQDGLREAVEAIDIAFNHPGEITGVPTGLTKLDSALGGFQPSDLYVIGARPSVGKTALIVNLMLAAGGPVGFVSTEQPRSQIGLRSIAASGKVSLHKMRTGNLNDSHWPKITGAVSMLRSSGVLIYDNASAHINDIVRIARKWKQLNSIKALYVDYLQRIDNDRDFKNRKEKVDDITRKLKNIGRELNIPVIALASVNRECEKRPDKRPNMADLADSSDIEKEADELMFLYRDEVYHPDSPDAGVLEINITKNRHGPIGKVRATWLGEFTAVTNYAPEYGGTYASHAVGR